MRIEDEGGVEGKLVGDESWWWGDEEEGNEEKGDEDEGCSRGWGLAVRQMGRGMGVR